MSQKPSRPNNTRRDVLKGVAAASAGYWLGTSSVARAASANEKLNVACIGIGGRGGANVGGVSGENIVALCDVDDARAGGQYKKFHKAKKFYDHRKMFDAMSNEIDAVVVSTPDHTHYHPSMTALLAGKHLYCEKPLAHNVWQVRQITKTAAENKLATQLGNQRHAHEAMRRTVELINAGAIGKVTEVHSWIGGSRGMPKIPTDTPPVPKGLDWDVWLGQAPERPLSPKHLSLRLEILVGLWNRRNWKLGLPYFRHPVLVLGSKISNSSGRVWARTTRPDDAQANVNKVCIPRW